MSERIPDLGDDAVRPAQHVSSCEAKEPDPGQQEPILAAIVLNEAGAMCLAIVFNAKSMIPVIKVWASEEAARLVTEGDLYLWTR